jgi:hypothetical protein
VFHDGRALTVGLGLERSHLIARDIVTAWAYREHIKGRKRLKTCQSTIRARLMLVRRLIVTVVAYPRASERFLYPTSVHLCGMNRLATAGAVHSDSCNLVHGSTPISRTSPRHPSRWRGRFPALYATRTPADAID